MIVDLRSYIITKISGIYPDKFEIDDPTDSDDVNTIDAENGYKIIMGTMSGGLTGSSYIQETPIEVHLFKKSGLEQTIIFDNAYDEAVNIKNELIVPTESKNQLPFNEMTFVNIVPTVLQNNDKIYKMTINLIVKTDFTFC